MTSSPPGTSVGRMSENSAAREFFESYTAALLARDAAAIAGHYAVPALIQFPEQAIAVSDPSQTEEFFTQAFGQYAGISEAHPSIDIVAETAHSIWADVTWSYDDDARNERNMYQLVRAGDGWRIAVLTPL